MIEFNAKLCELLKRKRSLHNFIEREARQYPGSRSRSNHRDAARKIHGWHELLAEIKTTMQSNMESFK